MMEHFDSNGLVIVGSLIIIISYLFNLAASRYSIPSVLLLIVLGVALKGLVSATGKHVPSARRSSGGSKALVDVVNKADEIDWSRLTEERF